MLLKKISVEKMATVEKKQEKIYKAWKTLQEGQTLKVDGYTVVCDDNKYGRFIRVTKSALFNRLAEEITIPDWVDVWDAPFEYARVNENKLEKDEYGGVDWERYLHSEKEVNFNNVQYLGWTGEKHPIRTTMAGYLDLNTLFEYKEVDKLSKVHIVANKLKLPYFIWVSQGDYMVAGNRSCLKNYGMQIAAISISLKGCREIKFAANYFLNHYSECGCDRVWEEWHGYNCGVHITRLPEIMYGLQQGELGFKELTEDDNHNDEGIKYEYYPQNWVWEIWKDNGNTCEEKAHGVHTGYVKDNIFDRKTLLKILERHGQGKILEYDFSMDVAFNCETLVLSFEELLERLDTGKGKVLGVRFTENTVELEIAGFSAYLASSRRLKAITTISCLVYRKV